MSSKKNIHTFKHRADQQADQLYDDGCGSSSKLPLIINMQNIQQHLDNHHNTFKKITRGATEIQRPLSKHQTQLLYKIK